MSLVTVMEALDPHLGLALGALVASIVLFVIVGVDLFTRGWQSYEERYVSGAERTLDAMYLTIPAGQVAYISVLCFVLCSLLWLWLLSNVWAAVIFGLAGLALPKLMLWWLKQRRERKFDRQLVEALSNLANSMKAGFSLPQALGLLAQEMQNPMRQEMGLVVREMQVGTDLQEALRHLYDRMPSQDLDLIITSIVISREVGGDLTEVFDNIRDTIRERHRIEGRIKALTAQGKLQGGVLCALPPLMFVALLYIAPGLVRPLYTEPAGFLVLGIVLVLMTGGIYTIKRIVTIEF